MLIFVTLFGTYAFFWQSRDWNTASRLMLTYALVDRHTLSIDGLETQTRDLAKAGSHYYTDKAPGQSLLGVPIYGLVRRAGGGGPHPVGLPEAVRYWAPDYWVTVGTSGLLTALAGVLVYLFALRLGAGQGAAVFAALAYGLGTPAAVYATLFYGHQSAGFFALASFFLIHAAARRTGSLLSSGWPGLSPRNPGTGASKTLPRPPSRDAAWMFLAGLCAGYSVVVEYPMATVGVLLAAYAVAAVRRWPAVLAFVGGAVIAGSVAGLYNWAAFGHPFWPGYASEVVQEFREVHTADNPLGLRWPRWELTGELLFGRQRGLFWYAPVLAVGVAGHVMLIARRQWGAALVSLGAWAALVAVNLSYPLWQGGWATGPRFLLPALPFLALGIAPLVSLVRQRWMRWPAVAVTAILALAGAATALAAVAVGGRCPLEFADPVHEFVWPACTAGEFERTLCWRVAPAWAESLAPSERWFQFLPLLGFWIVTGIAIGWRLRRARSADAQAGAVAVREPDERRTR